MCCLYGAHQLQEGGNLVRSSSSNRSICVDVLRIWWQRPAREAAGPLEMYWRNSTMAHGVFVC
jgi:hypothetical protein